MNNYNIDLAVAIIFFNRSDTLEQVFEQVRIARPSKLFLIQDGPRKNNPKDMDGIIRCRKVVEEKINWDCHVVKDYSTKNLGCGMRVYSGIKRAFEEVEELVILEDDCVPSQSMFVFCKELLMKYKYDERICSISGMNHLEEYVPSKDSYIFCTTGAIWGWATWKRVWDNMQYNMEFQDDKYVMSKFKHMYYNPYIVSELMRMGDVRRRQLKETNKLSAWTYQFRMIRYLQSQLIVVPTKNLVSNVGVTGDATHAADSLKKMPLSIQKVFFIPSHELNFPLVHPQYVMCDTKYDKHVWRIMGESTGAKVVRKIEGIIRQVIFIKKGDLKKLMKKFH